MQSINGQIRGVETVIIFAIVGYKERMAALTFSITPLPLRAVERLRWLGTGAVSTTLEPAHRVTYTHVNFVRVVNHPLKTSELVGG